MVRPLLSMNSLWRRLFDYFSPSPGAPVLLRCVRPLSSALGQDFAAQPAEGSHRLRGRTVALPEARCVEPEAATERRACVSMWIERRLQMLASCAERRADGREAQMNRALHLELVLVVVIAIGFGAELGVLVAWLTFR